MSLRDEPTSRCECRVGYNGGRFYHVFVKIDHALKGYSQGKMAICGELGQWGTSKLWGKNKGDNMKYNSHEHKYLD